MGLDEDQMALVATRLRKTINTFSARNGFKIVKYQPIVHDPILESSRVTRRDTDKKEHENEYSWCDDRVSEEYIQQTLNVYRKRVGMPIWRPTSAEAGDDEKDYIYSRPNLQIYIVVTLGDKNQLIALGVIAWGKYINTDFPKHDFETVHDRIEIMRKQQQTIIKKKQKKSKVALPKLDKNDAWMYEIDNMDDWMSIIGLEGTYKQWMPPKTKNKNET